MTIRYPPGQSGASTRHALDGHGQQAGILRPEYGDGWAELQCDECDATWVGPIGEACNWCATALDNMRRWQAEKVLEAPEVDVEDANYLTAVERWRERLHRAASDDAGLITPERARLAYEQAVRRAA
jgi:hypothetical protein